MSTPKNTLVRRSLRRFALGSGPLKRRSDRVQAIARFTVVVSFLLASPLAVGVATATTTHLQSVAAAQAAERTLVRAVLIEDATVPEGSISTDGGPPVARVPVAAVWSLPGGAQQTGDVLARPGTASGTDVRIWVDRAGRPTQRPLDRADIQAAAVGAGVLPLVGLPVFACASYAFLCVALDARRDRRWTEEWAAVEPQWNFRSR